jgi:hypothetical protein
MSILARRWRAAGPADVNLRIGVNGAMYMCVVRPGERPARIAGLRGLVAGLLLRLAALRWRGPRLHPIPFIEPERRAWRVKPFSLPGRSRWRDDDGAAGAPVGVPSGPRPGLSERGPRLEAAAYASPESERPSPPAPLPILGEGSLTHGSSTRQRGNSLAVATRAVREAFRRGSPLPGLGEGPGVRATTKEAADAL